MQFFRKRAKKGKKNFKKRTIKGKMLKKLGKIVQFFFLNIFFAALIDIQN